MTKENDLKKELLKQMDKNSDHKSIKIKSPQEIIARDMARVKRLKWITVFSWLLVFIGLIITEIVVPYPLFPGTTRKAVWLIILPTLVVVLKALILISVFFTISLYVRSRALSMKQIHIRLINIEEHLKKMSRDK